MFVFGFSRGAFTARSLVGMIRKCGILRRDRVDQYRAALTLYRNDQVDPDHEQAIRFRKASCVSQIEAIPVKVSASGTPSGS